MHAYMRVVLFCQVHVSITHENLLEHLVMHARVGTPHLELLCAPKQSICQDSTCIPQLHCIHFRSQHLPSCTRAVHKRNAYPHQHLCMVHHDIHTCVWCTMTCLLKPSMAMNMPKGRMVCTVPRWMEPTDGGAVLRGPAVQVMRMSWGMRTVDQHEDSIHYGSSPMDSHVCIAACVAMIGATWVGHKPRGSCESTAQGSGTPAGHVLF